MTTTPDKVYYFTHLEDSFFLISIKEKEKLLRVILQYFLSDDLFSINQEVDGAYSILIKSKNIQSFKEDLNKQMMGSEGFNNCMLEEIEYNCVQVTTENPGLQEVGMLSEVTSFFASLKIPILCISTYDGNHIYYPKENQDKFQNAVLIENEKYRLD